MDGIDGLAGVETASIALGIALLGSLWINLPATVALYGAALGGAALGFLYWNWRPARIFLGDVGSIPIGFLLGFLLLKTAIAGAWVAALVIPLYYLADATITLVKRLRRGEVIWLPHREHFYQQAARSFGRHDVVVQWIALGNLLLIAIAAVSTLVSAWFALLAPLLVGLVIAKFMIASRDDARSD